MIIYWFDICFTKWFQIDIIKNIDAIILKQYNKERSARTSGLTKWGLIPDIFK